MRRMCYKLCGTLGYCIRRLTCWHCTESEGLTFLDPKLKGTVAITYEETACSPLLAWAACFKGRKDNVEVIWSYVERKWAQHTNHWEWTISELEWFLA